MGLLGFMLSVVATAVGVAYGSARLFDVSFALGAFFAGMMMQESEFSQTDGDATPDSTGLSDNMPANAGNNTSTKTITRSSTTNTTKNTTLLDQKWLSRSFFVSFFLPTGNGFPSR